MMGVVLYKGKGTMCLLPILSLSSFSFSFSCSCSSSFPSYATFKGSLKNALGHTLCFCYELPLAAKKRLLELAGGVCYIEYRRVSSSLTLSSGAMTKCDRMSLGSLYGNCSTQASSAASVEWQAVALSRFRHPVSLRFGKSGRFPKDERAANVTGRMWTTGVPKEFVNMCKRDKCLTTEFMSHLNGIILLVMSRSCHMCACACMPIVGRNGCRENVERTGRQRQSCKRIAAHSFDATSDKFLNFLFKVVTVRMFGA